MTVRFPPRPLGRFAAALWALGIHLFSWSVPLVFGLLLFALDAMLASLVFPSCMASCRQECGLAGGVCSAARWFTSYWWMLALIVAYPLWLGTVIWMVRRVAVPGYRWRVAGFMLLMWVLPVFAEGASLLAQSHADKPNASIMAVLGAVGALGLWLAFRPLHHPPK